MSLPDYEDCLALVDRESPGLTDSMKRQFAWRLQEIAIKECESIERAWMISEYWD